MKYREIEQLLTMLGLAFEDMRPTNKSTVSADTTQYKEFKYGDYTSTVNVQREITVA